MAVEFTKVFANGGADYLLKTINDGAFTAADYYTHPGNKPGVWMGDGCKAMGVREGRIASKAQIVRLYNQLRNPSTGMSLKGPHARQGVGVNAVGGYDLTFSMPKSVNILWGTCDAETRNVIMKCFYESIDESMRWWQDNIAVTRIGSGGAAQAKVTGVTAARFDHWDTREHDPHLHSHVIVSNIAQREDGSWCTLDGRVIYRAQVDLSERHQNILLDKLHDRLGIEFDEREGVGTNSKAVVLDATGVPVDLIQRFSTRGMQTDRIYNRLVEERLKVRNGEPLSFRERAVLKEQAFQRARKAKDQYVAPLNELIGKWRTQVRELGYDPQQIAGETLGQRPEAYNGVALSQCEELGDKLEWLLRGSLVNELNAQPGDERTIAAEQFLDAAADTIADEAKTNATTITRFKVEAAAERLTRLIRCTPQTRQAFTDAVANRVLDNLVQLTPYRYQLDEHTINDPRISDGLGHAGVDNARNSLYATRELVDAEQHLFALADQRQESWRPDPEQVAKLVDEYSRRMRESEGHGMADDQAKAATGLLAGNNMIMALTGPAGTGKTTTMRAVKQTYDRLAGEGRVMGMATSAVAAGELGDSLEIPTSTVAKILHDNLDGGAERREQMISDLEQQAKTGGLTPHAQRKLAKLYAEQAANTIPRDGIVIVDEASMTSTLDLERIARLCEASNARMILTGDPHQLEAPGEGGGFLGWMERTDRTLKLTSVWRFLEKTIDPETGDTHTGVNRKETEASLALRDGATGGSESRHLATSLYAHLSDEHGNVTVNDHESGRIHGGANGSMGDKVFDLTIDALTKGRNNLLIVATNTDLREMNERISLNLQARGIVEADPMLRVNLRAGATAGKGDVVCTRSNDRRNVDQEGGFVKNGNLWTVMDVKSDGGMRLARRDNPNLQVDVSGQYARESCELGYAVTAHRSQGMTVDYGNLWVPEQGSVSRELLYVALTRGRWQNDVWIDTPDEQSLKDTYAWNRWKDINRKRLEHEGVPYKPEDLEPTAVQLAMEKFDTMTANSQEPITASETRERHETETKGIGRLTAERDIFIDMIMEPRLIKRLGDAFGNRNLEGMRDEGPWERILNTYAKAMAIDPMKVDEIIDGHAASMSHMSEDEGKLFDIADAGTLLSELNDDLRINVIAPTAGRDLGWKHGTIPAPEVGDDPDERNVGFMLAQNTRMIEEWCDRHDRQRIEELTGRDSPAWIYRMPSSPIDGDEKDMERWQRLILDVDDWRKRQEIHTPGPLGPKPIDREAAMERSNLLERIRMEKGMGNDAATADPAVDRNVGEFAGIRRAANLIVDLKTPDADMARRADRINRIVWDCWRNNTEGSWAERYAQSHGLEPGSYGYSSKGMTVMLDWARYHHVLPKELVAYGLVDVSWRHEYLDRFPGRLMLPILDAEDRILGFTGLANPEDHGDGSEPAWLSSPDSPWLIDGQSVYGDGAEAHRLLTAGTPVAWCGNPVDAEALGRAVELMDDPKFVPLAPLGERPAEEQLEAVRRIQSGTLKAPLFQFDADGRPGVLVAAAWDGMVEWERDRASGLILPRDAPTPSRLVGLGRVDELVERLDRAKPLYQCLTDDLAEHGGYDFARTVDQARFVADARERIGNMMPYRSWKDCDLYTNGLLDQKAGEANAKEVVHVPDIQAERIEEILNPNRIGPDLGPSIG